MSGRINFAKGLEIAFPMEMRDRWRVSDARGLSSVYNHIKIYLLTRLKWASVVYS